MPVNPDHSPTPYIDDGVPAGQNPWWDYGEEESESESEDSQSPGSSGDYTTKTCKLQIIYNANGASGNPPSSSTATYSGKLKKVTLKKTVVDAGSSMTYSGHWFLGWSTSSSGAPTRNPGAVISHTWLKSESGTFTTNLYAIWSDTGRFIYKPGSDANEAKDTYSTKYSNKSGTTSKLSKALYTRTGYTQTGWQLANGTYAADVNSNYTNSSNEVTLYPVWTANTYTIKVYDDTAVEANGVIAVPSEPGHVRTITATYDSEITLPGDADYPKEGYHLLGWNEQYDGNGVLWFPEKTYTFTRTSNINLFPLYEGNKYYVVYLDDDTASTASVVGQIYQPSYALDESNCIYSTEELEPLVKDQDNILQIAGIGATYIVDSDRTTNYDIATYNSEFYTQYRPAPKENHTFAGWETINGEILTKADYCMDSYKFGSNSKWTRQNNEFLRPIWTDEYPFGKIFFGRKESSEYKILIEEPPDYYWPEREYTHHKIKGRSGDVLSDSERYENVEKKYKVAVYDDGFRSASARLSEFLHRYDGYPNYVRLEDSYEPDVYMMGIYEEDNSVENILGQAGRTTITFNCKPQKYLLSGDREITITEKGVTANIENPTDHVAYPLVTVYGYGYIRFSGRPTRRIITALNSNQIVRRKLYIYDNYNRVTFDAENYEAVDVNGNSADYYVSTTGKIALYPGNNTIIFSDTIEKIIITPRWWRL